MYPCLCTSGRLTLYKFSSNIFDLIMADFLTCIVKFLGSFLTLLACKLLSSQAGQSQLSCLNCPYFVVAKNAETTLVFLVSKF